MLATRGVKGMPAATAFFNRATAMGITFVMPPSLLTSGNLLCP